MAYTTIDNGGEYFNTVLWTGDDASDKSISGVGFQPDLVWAKNRSDGNDYQIIDSSRGAGKILRTNVDGAELTRSSDVGAGGLQNFESDGFDVHSTTSNTNLNDDGELNVAWCWKCNGGSTTSGGGDDSITTSTYQANTTAGFSIVTYTGEASAKTVAHGLGVKPNVIIVKCRQQKDWHVYFDGGQVSDPETDYLRLNTTLALTDNDTSWNDTAPTTSVFTIGSGSGGDANGNTDTFVAYCFANVQGYSKFGSYTGNGNANGGFVYTGFKPAWIMVKATDTDEWRIYDRKRANAYNVINVRLHAESEGAESQDDNECDFLSNGVKWRSSSGGVNSDGQAYTYMAFAEHPFVSSKGIPATAR